MTWAEYTKQLDAWQLAHKLVTILLKRLGPEKFLEFANQVEESNRKLAS
jgi:hypothetical protein